MQYVMICSMQYVICSMLYIIVYSAQHIAYIVQCIVYLQYIRLVYTQYTVYGMQKRGPGARQPFAQLLAAVGHRRGGYTYYMQNVHYTYTELCILCTDTIFDVLYTIYYTLHTVYHLLHHMVYISYTRSALGLSTFSL